MCAFECDSAHYEGITTLCVCLCFCVCVRVLVCVRPSVCVFHGCSLRLINIDSELSLLAGSQVGSIEQI